MKKDIHTHPESVTHRHEHTDGCHCHDSHHHSHDGGHPADHDEEIHLDCCCHHHDDTDAEHGHSHSARNPFLAPLLSFLMLVAGMLCSHFDLAFFGSVGWAEYLWYIVAFLPVGLPVIKEAIGEIRHGDIFNEFTLMSIACIGAFCIRELPEAVGVMLFYSIGETLQHKAVQRATGDISALIGMKKQKARVVLPDGEIREEEPRHVAAGDLIEVLPGQRVLLDGSLESDSATFDTSALTGESVPRHSDKGDEILSGMILLESPARIRVTRPFKESALSRILDMVSKASSRKAHTELFIRRFARVYTPVVLGLALLLLIVPAIVSAVNPTFHYDFSQWLYRSLLFLVISCPCALVISVPLAYFASIGAASRKGILFKGGNYLEALGRVGTVAFDKTGTLTTGHFDVTAVVPVGLSDVRLLGLMAAAESQSRHPLAMALCAYAASRGITAPPCDSLKERPGMGAEATADGHTILAGNARLLHDNAIDIPSDIDSVATTMILCAVDGKYAGYVELSDTLKPDAEKGVNELRREGIENIVMLSGDRSAIVESTARRLGIGEWHAGLLPQGKAEYVERISRSSDRGIAFVGDGINDAPVLAVSTVGIAMGGLGSDAAIESADVVIQSDTPSSVATAVRIGRKTHAVVMQNIIGAIAIKVLVMVLGALGYATLWAAVFADVGVTLLAVLNSMRQIAKRK